jgi:hypothetical protein
MRMRLPAIRGRRGQRGQSIVEYLLVLCVMVVGLLFILAKLKESQFFYKRLTEPLVKYITYNYKYGDPTAQGWDEGTARNHIQIQKPQGATFRLFQPKPQ